MSTLLMRLAAPMQAWGTESKFDLRRTGREPSKSGVVGLVAAALGLKRDADRELARLAALRFGVRVDREGTMVRDYHTAKSASAAYVTQRWYLGDAVFVVGLEGGDEALLKRIEAALACPAFPLYLGRRSCPPTGRLCMGIVPAALEEALVAAPLEPGAHGTLRMVVEPLPGQAGGLVRDLPISFNPERHSYAYRPAVERLVRFGTGDDHDPMTELE